MDRIRSGTTDPQFLGPRRESTAMSKLPIAPLQVAEEERSMSERFDRLAAEWKEQSRFLSNRRKWPCSGRTNGLLGWDRGLSP